MIASAVVLLGLILCVVAMPSGYPILGPILPAFARDVRIAVIRALWWFGLTTDALIVGGCIVAVVRDRRCGTRVVMALLMAGLPLILMTVVLMHDAD